MENKISDLIVRYMFGGNDRKHELQFSVPDVKTAAYVIDAISNRDLKDDTVNWNFFDLEVFEDNENENDPQWYTWYSEDGSDIKEWMDENGF